MLENNELKEFAKSKLQEPLTIEGVSECLSVFSEMYYNIGVQHGIEYVVDYIIDNYPLFHINKKEWLDKLREKYLRENI